VSSEYADLCSCYYTLCIKYTPVPDQREGLRGTLTGHNIDPRDLHILKIIEIAKMLSASTRARLRHGEYKGLARTMLGVKVLSSRQKTSESDPNWFEGRVGLSLSRILELNLG
jgi:hypothetical protein